MPPGSPVYKLLGNSSATVDYVRNMKLSEQLSVHQTTFRLLSLLSQSYTGLQVKLID